VADAKKATEENSMRFVCTRATEFFVALAIALFGCMATNLSGQTSATKTSEAVFVEATVAAHNIEEAITEHITNDANFRWTKQLPEEKRELPPPLIKRDGSFDFDWTVGQHARYLMEELRQGIHQLQSVEKASGLDGIALAGARENWPKMRDISCHETPGIRYFDLDGFEQYCPEH
jgi:hypothetical protein